MNKPKLLKLQAVLAAEASTLSLADWAHPLLGER
jgi:hypothetical protein